MSCLSVFSAALTVAAMLIGRPSSAQSDPVPGMTVTETKPVVQQTLELVVTESNCRPEGRVDMCLIEIPTLRLPLGGRIIDLNLVGGAGSAKLATPTAPATMRPGFSPPPPQQPRIEIFRRGLNSAMQAGDLKVQIFYQGTDVALQ